MSSETGLNVQFFEADTPIASGYQVKVLLLGAVGPRSTSPLPKMDAELSALFTANDLRALGLIKDAGFLDGNADGTATFDWLVEVGINIVSLAGLEGGALPQIWLESGAMELLGAGDTEAEAFRPVVHNIGGVRIGLLACAERCAKGFDGRADILHPLVYDRVRMLQAQCDHVIVFCHAGLPKANLPMPEWRARYRRFVDAGASIVVGMPPSRVSGWEEYRNGLVFYGLGSLADDRAGSDPRSLAVSLTLERNGRFRYEARLLERSGDTLRLCADEAAKQAINERNALFLNEKAYLTRSLALCRETYDAWERETSAAHSPKFGRSLLQALLPQAAKEAKREDEAKLLALLENDSLRLAVRRALAARETEESGGQA